MFHFFRRAIRVGLLIVGAGSVIVLLWLLAGLPLLVDVPLNLTISSPTRADAIVCIGGVTGHDLPTDDGWQRIYTSHKQYNDALFSLRQRSSALLIALREWSAIAVYRWKGQL